MTGVPALGIQDLLATLVALAALLVLVRRTVGIVRVKDEPTRCGSCAGCPAASRAIPTGGATRDAGFGA